MYTLLRQQSVQAVQSIQSMSGQSSYNVTGQMTGQSLYDDESNVCDDAGAIPANAGA
jgi:hypothetical protein